MTEHNPQAAQQVMIRLRAILDLFDDTDIVAGLRLLDGGSRGNFVACLRAAVRPRVTEARMVRPGEELVTKTGHVITQAEIDGWVTEAERGYAGPTGRERPGEHWNARIIREQAEAGYDMRPAPPPHPELGPSSGHQLDGPADCRRCQMIRDNAHWLALPGTEDPEGERDQADIDADEFRDEILRARHDEGS